MTNPNNKNAPKYYKIIIKEHIDKKWTDFFDALDISYEKDKTVLQGFVNDQAGLHGLLNKIRDMNLTLLSVHQLKKKI